MKVSNTWKPVLSEKMTNPCIPTKSIQMYVEHLQKYSPSNKTVRLFKYNAVAAASSTPAANEDILMPSTSSLSSLYSRCPTNGNTKAKDLPTAVSKLIHIDLKQLTCGSGFDGTMFASAERNSKTNLPHVATEQRYRKCNCNLQQPIISNQQKGHFSIPTPKHAVSVIVNNVVYTPTGEKRRKSTVPTDVKMFSPKMVLQKMSKKGPSYNQQNKILSTQTVQLPPTIATLRITSTNKKPSTSNVKTEMKDIINKEGKDETKCQIKTHLDLPKTKLNCILTNKELPVLNLPHNNLTSLQRNEKKSNDLLGFNEQISKFHALHELVKVLRRQKRSYPENAFLQQLHKKLKKDKCHFNMARVQKLKDELNASSTANQNNRKENVKDKKQSYCRLRTFCSKVQPYSVVDRTTKTDLCTLATKVALSTSFKRNNSEPADQNELHSQQNKTSSIHTTVNSNNPRRYALRGHIKLSSSNGRLFSHIHLKQGNTSRRGFIIDDLKINLIDLEKKIRKYTHKRITPLCEESKLERNKIDRVRSRENTKIQQQQCMGGRASNSDEYKASTLQEETGNNKKPEFKISRIRKDTSVSLPDSMVFNKQASFSTKLPDKKNLNILENSILVRSCFHSRHIKSELANSKDSLQQQKSTTKEKTADQSIIKPDSKYACNRKHATRLKNNAWKFNNAQRKDSLSNDSTSKLTSDNSPRAATQGCSSSKVNKSQEENWGVNSPREMYNKDTLKAFTFRSQSFYSDYEHRKFRQF